MNKNKSSLFWLLIWRNKRKSHSWNYKNDVLKINEINRFQTPLSISMDTFTGIYFICINDPEIARRNQTTKIDIHSLGIDTWGLISYASSDGEPLRMPYSYRDTHLVLPKILQNTQRGGIQKKASNHEFQLAVSIGYLKRKKQFHLSRHRQNSFMPDALSYLLTGKWLPNTPLLLLHK